MTNSLVTLVTLLFQVEDVDKKFNALKEAEARGWQEEIKPVTRQKKVVKVYAELLYTNFYNKCHAN